MSRRVFVVATFSFVLVLTNSWQARAQAQQSGRQLLEAYASAWNRHDFAALDQLLAEDAIHEDIAQGFRGQGHAQIKNFMRENIEHQPDLNWRLTRVVGAGPVVAAEWTWTSTYTGDTPSGPVVRKRISARGASVATIEHGRIKQFSDYYDLASAFREIPTAAGSSDHPSPELAIKSEALEAKVRKAWEDYKNKNKDGFAGVLADGFVEVEEDGNGFRDAKAEVAEIDQFDIHQYRLTDFSVKPIGTDSALVTYIGEYHATFQGQPIDAKSAMGEVWVKRGNAWKILYVQETRVK